MLTAGVCIPVKARIRCNLMQVNKVLVPLPHRGEGCAAALNQTLEDRHAQGSLGGEEGVMLL